MGRLSEYARSRIVNLRRLGLTFVNIQGKLRDEDNVNASRQAISNCWRSFQQTGEIAAHHGGGHQAILQDVHLDFINNKLKENNELTARELQQMLREQFNLNASIPTVLRGRKKMGWIYGMTRYCQLITDKNKPLRLAFAEACLNSGDTFDDVIFVDECIVQMGSHTGRQCYQKGAPLTARLRPKPKHPYQVKLFDSAFNLHVNPMREV